MKSHEAIYKSISWRLVGEADILERKTYYAVVYEIMGPIIYLFDSRTLSRHLQLADAINEHFLEGIAS